MTLIQQARQAADTLGNETTYEDIIRTINRVPRRYRLHFALYLTSYLNDRRVRMPMLDEFMYGKLNRKIIKIWKSTR